MGSRAGWLVVGVAAVVVGAVWLMPHGAPAPAPRPTPASTTPPATHVRRRPPATAAP